MPFKRAIKFPLKILQDHSETSMVSMCHGLLFVERVRYIRWAAVQHNGLNWDFHDAFWAGTEGVCSGLFLD